MEERRQFPRCACSLEVEYYPKGNNIIYSHSVSRNISKGGICIPVLSRLVRTGDPISLDIYYNGDRKNPLIVKGEVVWTTEMHSLSDSHTSGSDAEAGIRFTNANPEILERLLQSLQPASNT